MKLVKISHLVTKNQQKKPKKLRQKNLTNLIH